MFRQSWKTLLLEPFFFFLWVAQSSNNTDALSAEPSGGKIRAISLDVTGTLVATKEPVIYSYHQAALWAQLPNPPNMDEMKQAFKTAYKERCIESPCFGGVEGIPGREWWRQTVRKVLEHSGRSGVDSYSEEDFERYFRRVYQHFGSPRGYQVLDDAQEFLTSMQTSTAAIDEEACILGVTSNTPTRHMESVLPMLDIDHHIQWFTCSQDVGHEKPAREIFADSLDKARFWLPDLQPTQVLHIGDSLACDFCGAKAFGFQALLLDRSDHPSVTAYQDWIAAPDYPGKSAEDIEAHTITNLMEIHSYLNTNTATKEKQN